MTLTEFIQRALLVPFRDKGRDWDGWDCWGSVYCAQREVYGVKLPEYLDYDSTREHEQIRSLIDSAKPAFDYVRTPIAGDIALFTLSGSSLHVALVVDRMNALHAEARLGTFIEPLNSIIWKKRLEGFYRACRNR